VRITCAKFTACIVDIYFEQKSIQRKMANLTYRESLPTSCPPADVTAPTSGTLWRLLKNNTITNSDFDSAAFKNPQKNYEDACEAKGISLVTTLNHCRILAKLPRMKHFKFAIEVTYDVSAGVWHQDRTDHVNWWIYESCKPLQLVGKIESLT
jgi:hypothetical protein